MSIVKSNKLCHLFGGSSSSSGSTPSKHGESDEENSELLQLKRKTSLPKLKRRASDVGKVTTLEYNAIVDAASSSSSNANANIKIKHSKKGSTLYAPKKELLKIHVEQLGQIAQLVEQIELLNKQTITLSARLDMHAREVSDIRLSINSLRTDLGSAITNNDSSSSSCIIDWFTDTK